MNQLKRNVHRTGVRDWPAKRVLLRALYSVLNDRALVQAVVEGWAKIDELLDEVDLCYGAFQKWDRSRPSGKRSRQFWNQVISDKKPTAGMAMLLSSSITEFAGFFEDQPDIRDAVGELIAADARVVLDEHSIATLQSRFGQTPEINAPTHTEMFRGDDYLLRCHPRITFEGPQTGLQNGHVHSHQFYNTPEAANAWAAMVESSNYRMYLECLNSLKMLIESEQWKDAVGNGVYNAAVTLGGGASPEKDWVIATSLLAALEKHGKQLTYVLNDISSFMIHKSVKSLQRRIMKSNADRIRIEYDVCDFLKLDMFFKRPACQAVVWAILGGTLGNVSELTFFRSIDRPSRIGDQLIIGIDTIERESVSEFEGRMTAEYRSKELDALLLAPIQGTVAEVAVNRPVVNVTVHYYDDRSTSKYSDVPNSRTAVFWIPRSAEEKSQTVLAHSTRYVLEDFLDFARQFGWHHLGTTGPSNSTFRQLLLRKCQ